MIGTVAKNRLPWNVEGKVLLKKNAAGTDSSSRARIKAFILTIPVTLAKTVTTDPVKGTNA